MNEVVRKINIDNRTIRLTKPDNYSFAECNKFLDRGYDDCLYTLEENRVLKPLKFHGKKTLISVSDDADNLVVEVLLGDLRRDELKRSEEHTSELQSRFDLVCRLLLEKKHAAITKIPND